MVALPNGSNETAEIVADVLSTIGRDDEIASYLIATLKNETTEHFDFRDVKQRNTSRVDNVDNCPQEETVANSIAANSSVSNPSSPSTKKDEDTNKGSGGPKFFSSPISSQIM